MVSMSRRKLRVAALSEAESLLQEGRALYESGERMRGFKAFERALNQAQSHSTLMHRPRFRDDTTLKRRTENCPSVLTHPCCFVHRLQEDMTPEVRTELLYCCMACNAAVGGVETAKMYLR